MKVNVMSIETDILHLLRGLFREVVDADPAALTVQACHDGGMLIEIHPIKPGCASINVTVENGSPYIFMDVGQDTVFEILLRNIWAQDRMAIEDMIAMIAAVVAGKFEETIWMRRGSIVKSYGKLLVERPNGEEVIDMPHWHRGYNPFRKGDRQYTKYLPWGITLNAINLD